MTSIQIKTGFACAVCARSAQGGRVLAGGIHDGITLSNHNGNIGGDYMPPRNGGAYLGGLSRRATTFHKGITDGVIVTNISAAVSINVMFTGLDGPKALIAGGSVICRTSEEITVSIVGNDPKDEADVLWVYATAQGIVNDANPFVFLTDGKRKQLFTLENVSDVPVHVIGPPPLDEYLKKGDQPRQFKAMGGPVTASANKATAKLSFTLGPDTP